MKDKLRRQQVQGSKFKMRKFNGSYGWLWFWIIGGWPIAIVYWAVRQEEVKKGHRAYGK